MCYLLMSASSVHAALFSNVLALLLLSVIEGQQQNSTLVSSAKDLASALSNFQVGNIYINGKSCPGLLSLSLFWRKFPYISLRHAHSSCRHCVPLSRHMETHWGHCHSGGPLSQRQHK